MGDSSTWGCAQGIRGYIYIYIYIYICIYIYMGIQWLCRGTMHVIENEMEATIEGSGFRGSIGDVQGHIGMCRV